LLAQLYPQQPADAIVSARSLTPIIEPRLDLKGQATAWYLFGDTSDGSAVFEFAELHYYHIVVVIMAPSRSDAVRLATSGVKCAEERIPCELCSSP